MLYGTYTIEKILKTYKCYNHSIFDLDEYIAILHW